MCAQEAPSAKRSTTVQLRGALLNEVLRYSNAARAATRGAGGDRRTSDSKEKGKKTKKNCFYILEYVIKVCTVLFYDKSS